MYEKYTLKEHLVNIQMLLNTTKKNYIKKITTTT